MMVSYVSTIHPDVSKHAYQITHEFFCKDPLLLLIKEFKVQIL